MSQRYSSRVPLGRGDGWQRGESLKAIGRAFGKPSSSIYFQVASHGAFVLRRGTARGWS